MTIISLSWYAVRNTPGELMTLKYRFSVLSIVAIIRTDSVEAVREVMSEFSDQFLCFWPSATARPFIFPHIFFSRNISTRSAPRFCILLVLLPFTGWKTTLPSICFIYYFVAFITSLPKFFRPSLRVSCIKTCTRRLVYWSLGYLCSKFGCRRGLSSCLFNASHTNRSSGEGELTWNSYPPSSLVISSYFSSFLSVLSPLSTVTTLLG